RRPHVLQPLVRALFKRQPRGRENARLVAAFVTSVAAVRRQDQAAERAIVDVGTAHSHLPVPHVPPVAHEVVVMRREEVAGLAEHATTPRNHASRVGAASLPAPELKYDGRTRSRARRSASLSGRASWTGSGSSVFACSDTVSAWMLRNSATVSRALACSRSMM